MPGLTRWVRPPGPWRPSKLRLDVLAAGGDATSRVFVLPMHDAVQVYRVVRGPEAV